MNLREYMVVFMLFFVSHPHVPSSLTVLLVGVLIMILMCFSVVTGLGLPMITVIVVVVVVVMFAFVAMIIMVSMASATLFSNVLNICLLYTSPSPRDRG